MRRHLPLLLLCLFFPTCSAQQKTPPKPEQKSHPAPPGRLTGTVLCSDTRKPARGASVYIGPVNKENGMGRSAVVGLDGTYTLEAVKPGKYHIVTSFYGYRQPLAAPKEEPHTTGRLDHSDGASNFITVASSQTVRYDLSLERGAAINGRVLFADGSPAVGALIQIEDATASLDKPVSLEQKGDPITYSRVSVGVFHNRTDDLGRFRIASLYAGHYRVAAIPVLGRSYISFDVGTQTADLTYYAGDTLHRKGAQVFEVKLGDEVNDVEISIPLVGFHAVSGSATATDSRILNKGLATLRSVDDPEFILRTAFLENGSFLFGNVPSGTYNLTIDHVFITAETEDGDREDLHAFAEETRPIILNESDVPDLHFTLKEIPMSKGNKDGTDGSDFVTD